MQKRMIRMIASILLIVGVLALPWVALAASGTQDKSCAQLVSGAGESAAKQNTDPSFPMDENADTNEGAGAGEESAPPDEEAPEIEEPMQPDNAEEEIESAPELPEESTPQEPEAADDTDLLESESEEDALANEEESIVVNSFYELRRVLTGTTTYPVIYIGRNITAESGGIAINAAHEHVVISGTPPGSTQTYSYLVSSGIGLSDVIDATNTQSVTFRDIDLRGSNTYGVAMVSPAYPGVVLRFINVNDTTSRIATNDAGTIYLSGVTMNSSGGALIRAETIQLDGYNELNSTSSSGYLFWSMGDTPSIEILSGAQVYMNLSNVMTYSTSAIDMTIQPGAEVQVEAARGITDRRGSLNTLNIQENATVFMRQQTASNVATLRLSGDLVIGKGAEFMLDSPSTGVSALQMLTAGATIQMNEPRLVRVDASSLQAIDYAQGGSMAIHTGAINLWRPDDTTPADDGIENLPSYMWNKKEGSLQLQADFSGSVPGAVHHNLTEEDPAEQPLDEQTFNLAQARQLILGDVSLSITSMTEPPELSISGSTTGSAVGAHYTDGQDVKKIVNGSVGEQNMYTILIEDEQLVEGTSIAVVTSKGVLKAVQREVFVWPILAITNVPSQIEFPSVALPTASALLSMTNKDFSISVMDTRSQKTPWEVQASLSTPLTAVGDDESRTLPDALVYKNYGGVVTPLGPTPIPVYRAEGDIGNLTNIRWDEGYGILLSLVPGMGYANVDYTATIDWTLVNGPQ